MEHLKIIENKPRDDGAEVPRTDANWRNGNLMYDHSQDEVLAQGEGPEAIAAQARLLTKKYLEFAKPAQPSET